MFIDVTQVLTDFDCKPLTEDVSNGEVNASGKPIMVKEEITLRKVLCAALLNPSQKDQNLQADEKIVRYDLALRIHDAGRNKIKIDLSHTDRTLLERLISDRYAPLMVGICHHLLADRKETPDGNNTSNNS